MALVLTIDAVNRTSVLKVGSLRVEQRAASFVSTCHLTLVDEDHDIAIAIEDDITVVDGATTYFVGRVVTVDYRPFTSNSRNILLECQDKNAHLNEVVIDVAESFPIAHLGVTADADIIDQLFDDYFFAVDSVTHVDTLQDPLTIVIGPCTIRQALSQICARTGGIFYVDSDNALHYFDAEAIAAGWFLSDTPDQINSFSYFDKPRKQSRAVTRLDGVFVVGNGVSGWRGTHGAGDRTAIVRDPNITNQTALEARGDSIIARYALAQDTYFVSTYKAGLYAGIDIRFVCALYGVDDTFTVRKAIVKWDVSRTAYYELELGDLFEPALEDVRDDGDWDVVPGEDGPPIFYVDDVVFSAVDRDTLEWTGGDLVTSDGTTYTVVAGNTGFMAALTWIYLDLDVSETVLQTSLVATDAMGPRILRVAWGDPVTDPNKMCTFLVFEGFGAEPHIIDEENIVEGAVTPTILNPTAFGTQLFTPADGLLLLGPEGEINSTEWWSLRRQLATISGAFHQEAGFWQGTKGLVIELGTTNAVINPSAEVNSTGYIGANLTVTRSSDRARFGDYAVKGVATANNASLNYQPGGAGGKVGCTTATPCTLSWWIHADVGGDTIGIRWLEYNGGAYLGQSTTENYTLVQGWQRLTVSSTTRATCDGVIPFIVEIDDTRTYYFDGLQFEDGMGIATTYCDGSLGTGYAWTDGDHASTSTRAATEANLDDLVGLVTNNNTLSFRIVAQMPYDADAVWTGATVFNFFMDIMGVSNAHRIFVTFDVNTNALYAYLNGDYRLGSAAQTFDAGDWLDIIVTLDYTADSYKLYINGALEDTDTTAMTAPTLSDWNLGAASNAAAHSGSVYAEYAVFDRVLTADEVAMLWTMNRPLEDSGSTDSPHVTILDGRFNLASGTAGSRVVLDKNGLEYIDEDGNSVVEIGISDAAPYALKSAPAGNDRIEITVDEIAGYDAANVKQFYLDAATGKAYFGGGSVRLDENGARITATGDVGPSDEIRWMYESDGEHIMAQVYAGWAGGAAHVGAWLMARRKADSPWPEGVRVNIAAIDDIAGDDVRIIVYSEGTIRASGCTLFKVDNLLRPGLVADAAALAALADIEDGCLIYQLDTDKLKVRAAGAWVNLN